VQKRISLLRIALTCVLYAQCVALRDEVLPKPLGLGLTDEELNDDKESAIEKGVVIGTVSLKQLGVGKIQLKQMAVTRNKRAQA
jgi:hypothetical protein